ncbi:ubiquitin-conjugating enzyme E2 4-like [Drosophila subobscura]|uniref:ubiquitin-conjugating enzyme E2 4-like n=1 Tax=Drosophila subobscura TaxID=7241 RepID=UPI00155A710D|nr:ubiquitin-conjugating enzyme E2 4-like [Drosophila subobscura]
MSPRRSARIMALKGASSEAAHRRAAFLRAAQRLAAAGSRRPNYYPTRSNTRALQANRRRTTVDIMVGNMANRVNTFGVRAEEENPAQIAMGHRRLQIELAKMMSNPTEGCQVMLLDNSIYNWKAIIIGPADTPYEGGHFELSILFPNLYPCEPPTCEFLTKIYHCNIECGLICLDILETEWSAALTVEKLLLSILSLLSDPNSHSPMNSDAAKMYLKNRTEHDRTAREWTALYAKPDTSTPISDE